MQGAAISDGALCSVELLVDGRIVTLLSAPAFSYAWNTTGLTAGGHTVEVRAWDTAGQPHSAWARVTLNP